ncbi:MAG TPA: YraN family protein [Bryobacteraceae bacterium]|nr:YraN family protein [Bryobacteraceae bacterium]
MKLGAWLAARFPRPTLGERGERAAARHLRRLGYTIIARRHRSRYGEFDVIAVDGRTVVFVEVKTRRSEAVATAAEAVDRRRRERMTRAANAYLKSHSLLECAARFDIVEVIWPLAVRRPTIRHHKNAFPAEGSTQFFR